MFLSNEIVEVSPRGPINRFPGDVLREKLRQRQYSNPNLISFTQFKINTVNNNTLKFLPFNISFNKRFDSTLVFCYIIINYVLFILIQIVIIISVIQER